MVSNHQWDVKNGLVVVLHFFSLISDGLGGVARDINRLNKIQRWHAVKEEIKWSDFFKALLGRCGL